MTTNGMGTRPLPDGWTWTTVSNVGDIVTGTTPQKADPENYGNFIPFIKPGDLDAKESVRDAVEYLSEKGAQQARVIPPGSVMVTCIGATIGKTNISSITVATNQQINSVVVKRPIQPKYVYFYCLSNAAQDWIKATASSTTLPILNKSKFSRLPLPLAPFAEQERIVAEIEKQFTRLDQAVVSLRRLQTNLARYKASVLKAACEGRLVPQDPTDEPADELRGRILTERRSQWQTTHPGKKYPEPTPVDTSTLPNLPKGWVWTTMDQIADQRLGKMLDKSKNIGRPRPYLRNASVRWFGFDLSDIQEMRVPDDELESVSIQLGDLVICEGGEPGRSAVWEKEEPFVIQKALHRVRPRAGISPWYLTFRLASDAQTGKLEKYFTGSTIKHFTGQSLRLYLVPLPPLAEQQRIVAEVERRLSVITATEQAITINLARAERLRQSILHRAFTGQLVPQDA